MGSWSKDDENGNANGKKAIGFDKQNKNYARVSLLLYISLPSLHDVPQRQTSYLILRLKEEANTRRGLYFFPSFFPSFSLSLFSSLTQTQYLRILRQKIHQNLTNSTTWKMSCNEGLRPELPRFFYGSVALRRGTSNQYIIDSISLLENSDLSESPVSLTEKKYHSYRHLQSRTSWSFLAAYVNFLLCSFFFFSFCFLFISGWSGTGIRYLWPNFLLRSWISQINKYFYKEDVKKHKL